MRYINLIKVPIFIIYFQLFQLNVSAQDKIPLAHLEGKYQFDGGMAIQFMIKHEILFLITPGNPLQEMQSSGKNEFLSKTIKGDQFLFEQNAQDSIYVIIKNAQGTIKGTKTSGQVTDYSESMDSLLTVKKSSDHFEFWFSEIDIKNIDSLIHYLEKDYSRILNDFKLQDIPKTRVKIYPDLQSFHTSINQPDAPPQVLATAFGKDEFRMVSPTKGGEELMKFISHEFTHCVHLNIDYSPNNPRWLWEGLAMYEAEWFMDPKEIDDIKNKNYPSLKGLGNGMEYMLGYVIIEAIKDLWGFETVINLVKNQGNIQKVMKISDEEFEKKVFGSIYAKYIKI